MPDVRRAEAWRTELVRIDDYDGSEVWKVSRFTRGALDANQAFEEQCASWATHTP